MASGTILCRLSRFFKDAFALAGWANERHPSPRAGFVGINPAAFAQLAKRIGSARAVELLDHLALPIFVA